MSNEWETKVCGACGNTFGCGAKLDGCWCSEIDLPPNTAGELRSKYADCLCAKCLAALATSPSMVLTYSDGSIEIVPGAVRVDTQNFHEGMFDFYDERGNLLKQVDMGSGMSWDEVVPAK